MGIKDFYPHVKSRFKKHPLKTATLDTIHDVYIGGLRRIEAANFAKYDSHWNENWEILVVLDACRTDLFEQVVEEHEWLPEKNDIITLRSHGSTSKEWLEGMFSEENRSEMTRTGYITGNMFYKNVNTKPLALLSVVEPEKIEEYDITTVPPRQLTNRAITGWHQRDSLGLDRLIVHYMQPHTPFRSQPNLFDADRPLRTSWGRGFARLRDRELKSDEFWAAYRDNLNWVLKDVNLLRQNVDARVGISADHGNGFGEWFVYGHPGGVPVEGVRTVPYAEIDSEDNNTYSPNIETIEESPVSGDIEEHLEALGYR